ncbi:MAG: hypothetical protein JOY61_17235, partial [Chloroflexi bacterium]|nr:hypothetical protein [Chloroflexota bacterium]
MTSVLERAPHELLQRRIGVAGASSVRRRRIPLVATIAAVVVIFGLPHLLIPRLLHPGQTYTPFAVDGVSALTFDKTSTYGAQLNYMVEHRAWPYDTDVFEARDTPTPVATAPYVPLAVAAVALGGVDRAVILADFVLPALACLILYALLVDMTRSWGISLVGALVTVLASFGPRNFIDVPLMVFSRQFNSVVQPLEYSRLLHPEVSFTLFAAALLFLWRAIRNARVTDGMAAGILGGLLFYTYVYYWPVWVGACALLFLGLGTARRVLLLTGGSTVVVGLPFWWMFIQEHGSAPFVNAISRHSDTWGRVPPSEKIVYTFVSCAIFAILATLYVRSAANNRRVLAFFAAVFVASIAAFNMELVTGFSVESMLHFPNRLFQPFFSLAAFGLALPILTRRIAWRRLAPAATSVAVTGLIGVALLRQVLVSENVAPQHVLSPDKQLLFTWLDQNSRLDDVVVAEAADLNELLPVFTRDRPFVAYGERTGLSYTDLMQRFLIGMKLLQTPPEHIRALLAQDHDHADPPVGLTYSYFLFIGAEGMTNWRLSDGEIDAALERYQTLNLSTDLGG